MALKTQNLITFRDLMGGECLVGTPEVIPDNCLQLAYNWEYGGEVIQPQVVPGVLLKLDLTTSADGGFYDPIHDVFLVASAGTLYTVPTDFSTKTSLGSLTGSGAPVFALYDTYVLIASGGVLQEYNGTTLANTSGAPTCDHVSVVGGRVRVYDVDGDAVTYSAIGDRTGWTNTPSDISTSQYINVGYKDAGTITGSMRLSQDFVVFKSSGVPYRIVNENDFANVAVIPAAEKAYAYNHYCGLTVGNIAYFLGSDGFQSVSTTDAYGAVKVNEPAPGYFINPWLALNSDTGARLWHIPSRRQIWVKGQSDKLLFMYHYNVKANGVAGSWTRRTFTYQINDVMIRNKDVYVLYGNKIGLIDDTLDTDDSVAISYNLITKRHIPTLRKYIINHINYRSFNLVAGSATLEIGGKTYPYTFSPTGEEIYGNTTEIYGDTAPIVSDQFSPIRKDLQKAVTYLEAKISGSSGRFAIHELSCNASEVNV